MKTADSSKSELRWTACVTRGKSCRRASTFERHLSSWEKGSVVKEEEDFLTLRRELDTQLPRLEAKIAELDEKIPEVSYLLRKANERVDS